jgi:hypothetical protein
MSIDKWQTTNDKRQTTNEKRKWQTPMADANGKALKAARRRWANAAI